MDLILLLASVQGLFSAAFRPATCEGLSINAALFNWALLLVGFINMILTILILK